MWLLLASCGGGPVRFDADFFAIVSPHRKAWRWRGRSTIVCRRGSRSTWRKPKGFSKMQPVDAASYVSWIRVRSSAFCWRVERRWWRQAEDERCASFLFLFLAFRVAPVWLRGLFLQCACMYIWCSIYISFCLICLTPFLKIIYIYVHVGQN